MQLKSPPGVFDIIPEDDQEPWKSSYIWNYVEQIIRKTAKEYGFKEIRTPLFEKTELFQRGVGEETDIVSKEMYTFEDRGGRSLTLRPEGTAPVIRSFIENRLDLKAPSHKVFYIAPMFRYERSQAGRFRQHHQFGAEVIGISSPMQDAEIIALLYTLYQRLGISNLSVNINSLGDSASRAAYREKLVHYLQSKKELLSEDSKRRLETNPLRVLDSKAPEDQEIVKNAPLLADSLSQEAKDHFEQVKGFLNSLEIPFQVAPHLVRGLDYYNYTVFEVVSGNLGSQNSLAGGGRYDGLLKKLGGPDLPSIGFGTGIERIIQTMLNQLVPHPPTSAPTLYVIPLGEDAMKKAFQIVQTLRQQGISVLMDYSKRKLQKSMNDANDLRAKYVAVIGDTELSNEEVMLKEMESGQTFPVKFSSLKRILTIDESKDQLAIAFKELNEPFENEQERQFFIKQINAEISSTEKLSSKLQDALSAIQKLINHN